MSILKNVMSLGSQLIEVKKSYSAYKIEYANFIQMPRTRLSKEDKAAIKKMWGKVIPMVSWGYKYFEVYKCRTDNQLDPRFIPPSYMFPTISRCLNPIKYINALSYKGLYPILFEGYDQAKPVIQCENSFLLDFNNRIISIDNAVDLLTSINNPVIIKASTETSGGKNIRIIENLDKQDLKKILTTYGKDYVIQEIVTGSQALKALNPYNLSTMRIMTLALNGNITVHPSMLRIGGKSSIVDNLSSGGSCVGIREDGTLFPHSYAYSGNISYESNGIQFDGFKIPHFNEIKDFAISMHSRIPMCGFAGWDITLDENNKPTLIEVNLNWPSSSPQICCGIPAFDNRTEEVIDYVQTVKRAKPFYYLLK